MKLLKTLLFLTLILTGINIVNAQQRGLNFAVTAVFKDYLEIKNALVVNNAGLVQNKAGKLIWDLNMVPTKDMNNEQHSTWFDYLSRIQSTGREISESNSISYQRKYFSALSNALYAALKTLNLNSSTIYKQYSASNDSYWLNDSPVIKNPYYGITEKQGVKEGTTREVLPPALKK
jgi:Cu(I)/Ag(I) efflux system membrane fusion protein